MIIYVIQDNRQSRYINNNGGLKHGTRNNY